MKRLRTQVAIVGAGPAGLVLGHLLHLTGIESVIIEDRSREHVIERVRAGVLEQATVDLLVETGAGGRLVKEGLFHDGIYLNVRGERRRIDMAALTGGRRIAVYGQNEVVRDLIELRERTGGPLLFEVASVGVHDLDSGRPAATFTAAGEPCEVRCDFIAGCDGFHGVCRPTIPDGRLRVYEREYPFGWLGILAEAPPSSPELVYSLHDRGFALFSMRSNAVTRLYLQCEPDEDVGQWPDDRIWEELLTRHCSSDGWTPNVGPILQKGVTGMRSFVAEPMRYGRLFLAGDAAHIVPPTGAKGLNLAVADVWRLSRALAEYFRTGREELLERYSDDCLRRVWRAQRFSWWMTSMLHRADTGNPFDYQRQLAELEYVTSSRAAMTSLAENYVGMPLE
jgi:p-hydroxybenzoate 3-monooxygenase